MADTIAARLAAVGSAIGEIPLAATTLDAVNAVILDWCGATIGGSNGATARVLMAGLASAGGPSRVVGHPRNADPATAALINGTAAHALEVDDIYAPGLLHPGAPVVAAALAAADSRHANGEAFLRAVAAGYEVGGRLAADLGASHYVRWHTTGTAGTVAAAAAAASLVGCDRQETMHALCLAATMAAGLQQTFRSDAVGKPLHAGHAAHAGVVAAFAAAGGLSGAAGIFEGEAGLAAAMGGSGTWSNAARPVGRPFVVEEVTVKPYPCCGHTFAAIDGALELRTRVGVDEIVKVEIATYRTALAVAGNPSPQTPSEARFSIPFAVAAALDGGVPCQQTFDRMDARPPRVRRLMASVSLTAAPAFEETFPVLRGAQVTVRTTDGAAHVAVIADRKGSPQRPLPPEQVAAKARALAEPVLGKAATAALLKSLRELPGLNDVLALPLQPSGAAT